MKASALALVLYTFSREVIWDRAFANVVGETESTSNGENPLSINASEHFKIHEIGLT